MNALAVDFGGRRIKLGWVRNGVVMASDVIAAQAHVPLRDRLDSVAAALTGLCQAQGVPVASCDGIGVSYPSIIDTKNARILDHFGKFGDASSLDLRDWAKQRLGLPLAIDNDARTALLGEWKHGAGRGCDNLVMVMLGTGLGVSAVIEGQVLRGTHGQAGILGGHLTVNVGGRACVCGNYGCAEAEASTSVLPELARAHPDFKNSRLATEPEIDYATLFRLAGQGDQCALALQEQSLQVWSAMAVSLIHAYDPERLIFGGGVMGSDGIILPAIRAHIGRRGHTPWGKVSVVASELGDQAALLGCEWLVQEHILNKI